MSDSPTSLPARPPRRMAALTRALRVPFPGSLPTTVALAVLGFWLLAAAAAPMLAPYAPLHQDLRNRLAPPSGAHWLGTDPLGRDILSRVLFGARISIPVGLAAVGVSAVLGIAIGSAAGLGGRATDEVLMRATDLLLSFPTVILALLIVAALGAGLRNAIVAVVVAWWPTYARLTRGLVLSAKERDYVRGAHALGASGARVALWHVLPTVVTPLLVMTTLDVALAILTFASLSFLGLGPPPDAPEWGTMIAMGRNYLDQWWIGTFPGLAILSLALAVNVVGDGLRDALDPQGRTA